MSEPRAALRTYVGNSACVGVIWVGGLSSRVANDRGDLWVGLQGGLSLL